MPDRAGLLLLLLPLATAELVIKVSRGEPGSNVVQQSLAGNTSADTVTVSFVTAAGVGVRQLTDFQAGLTVTVVTVPGEQELGQPLYQQFCFLAPAAGDLISAEAVSKLRQKHPGSVRVAEESRGRVVVEHSLAVAPTRTASLSPHIPDLCREAATTTFATEMLVSQYVARAGNKPAWLLETKLRYGGLDRCAGASLAAPAPCLCTIDSCLLWFPCSLKYCRNSGGEGGEHRCGIRTCSKCTEIRFPAASRLACSWDEI